MYCVSYRNSNIFQYVVAYENGGSFIQYKDIPILFDKEKAEKVSKDVLRHMSNFSDVVVKIHEVSIDSGTEVKEKGLLFTHLKIGEVFDFPSIKCRSVKISDTSYVCIDENPSLVRWKYQTFYNPPDYVKRVETN